MGGISGYVGGAVDTVIQRIIEFLISVPTLPLWMGLTAGAAAEVAGAAGVLRDHDHPVDPRLDRIARVVRGKLLELRSGDFVVAARLSGATAGAVIRRHRCHRFLSYLIVHLTLAVPNMMLGETAFSFILSFRYHP